MRHQFCEEKDPKATSSDKGGAMQDAYSKSALSIYTVSAFPDQWCDGVVLYTLSEVPDKDDKQGRYLSISIYLGHRHPGPVSDCQLPLLSIRCVPP